MCVPMEKVNWGVMPEIPEICINNFSMDYIDWSTTKAFFMTHIDSDLVRQVLEQDFLSTLLTSPQDTVKLYMHEGILNYLYHWLNTDKVLVKSKILLTALLKYLVKAEKLICFSTHSTRRLVLSPPDETKSWSWVDVTPMYAGHDVGAVMLLFERADGNTEDQNKRILYTGNCRLTMKDIQIYLSPLFHDLQCSIPKYLDKVYLDTTYCVRQVEELPARGTVTFSLIEELALMMRDEPKLRMEFTSDVKGGHCRLFDHIANELCQQIHVPSNLKLYYSSLPYMGFRVSCQSDEERMEFGNFHYGCGEEHDHEKCVGDLEDWGVTSDVVEIQLSCRQMPGNRNPPKERASYSATVKNLFWSNGSPVVYDTKPHTKQALYSANLSRFELGRLVKALNVKIENVVPLYKPVSARVEDVKKLIRETCEVVGEEPCFISSEMAGYWFDMSNMFEEQPFSEAVGPSLELKVHRHYGSTRKEILVTDLENEVEVESMQNLSNCVLSGSLSCLCEKIV